MREQSGIFGFNSLLQSKVPTKESRLEAAHRLGSWLFPLRTDATHLDWSSIIGNGTTCHGRPMKDNVGFSVQKMC